MLGDYQLKDADGTEGSNKKHHLTVFTLYYRNWGGGYFKRLCRMMKACAEAGHHIHYISPKPFEQLAGCPGVTWHKAPLPGPDIMKAAMALCIWPVMVWKLSMSYKVDRFAVFGFPYAAICGLAAAATGARLVTFVRSDWMAELELAGRSWFTRTVGKLVIGLGEKYSDRIVANSESLLNRIAERCRGQRTIGLLPNDIELSEVHERSVAKETLANRCGFPHDSFVVGYVGTFKPRKQVWQVIDVFSTIRDTPSVLVLVGDGADRDRVLNRIKELGLQSQVYWLGWQEEVAELLAGMDVTVLPSRFEGSPNAVLESIAVGTPVIAANVMGVTDTLPPEALFPPDDVETASLMLRTSVLDKTYYAKLVKAAEDCRQKFLFDWDAAIVKIIEGS